MRLSIKALSYFLTAAERGSIARAAEELHVVPSAVASAIEQVEQEFGLKLLQRYPAKGIRPTAAGIELMRKIRHLLDEYQNLMLEGAELRTALSGRLSVGYYAPVAPAFMPSIIGPLVRDNPDVRVNFVECDNEGAQAGLLNGAFDVIVFVAENVRPGIEWEALIEAPPYVLVPGKHHLAKRPYVTFDDLDQIPLVLLDLPFTSEYCRALLEAHGLEASFVATASTTEMVRSLVGAGVGCALLNMRPATDVSYAGDKIKALPLRTPAKPLKLVLGQQSGKPRRLVEAFADACRAHFARSEADDLIVPAKS